jgi:pyruvate ferredoxin oxidoreductase gamma subunit
MKYHKDIFEVIFFARGGQGAKTAAEILAQAGTYEDKFVQAFPNFGPERSGAPTKTYLRISESEIRTHEPVVDPDLVVVLDDTLLDSQEVTFNLDKNEFLIINTTMAEHQVREKLSQRGYKFEGKIFPIDAIGISVEIVGQPRPNTVILGKFVKVSGMVKLESVIEEFRHIFEGKIGKEITDKNVQAIEKAYDSI